MILQVSSHVGKVMQSLNPNLFQLIPITLNILFEFFWVWLNSLLLEQMKLYLNHAKQFLFQKILKKAFRGLDYQPAK
jgi:hypothetical protein